MLLAALVVVAAATVNDDSPAVWGLAVVALLGVVGFRWMRGRLARVDALVTGLSALSR